MEKEIPRRSAKKKQDKEAEQANKEAEVTAARASPEPKTKTADIKADTVQGRFSSSATRLTESMSPQGEKTGQSLRFQITQRRVETPRQTVAPLVTATGRKLTPEQLECEADLYACIATLNSLMINFEKGNVELSTYKRQAQSLITDIMKSKTMLEKTGISMEDFLREERIQEQYPHVCDRFKLLESDATLEAFIESLTVTKADVASGTAEIVTNLITLSDYTHLGGDMAKVESMIPLVDKLLSLLRAFPTTRKDYWGLDMLREWQVRLSTMAIDAVLTPEESRRLELDVTRLLDDFKRRLRHI